MKTNLIRKSLVALGLAFSTLALAAEPQVKWNAPVAADQSLLQKSASVDAPIINDNREPVVFSYPIGADQVLDFSPPVHTEKSRQYWLDSTGDKLATGVKLPLTGGETVIRISPLSAGKAVSLNAGQVQLQAGGKVVPLDVFADAQSVKRTGVPFPANTVAFKAHLPPGKAVLKVTGLGDKVPVVVHVFEPESSQVLELATSKATFSANEAIQVIAAVRDGQSTQDARWQGYISLPDGRVAGELKFTRRADGRFQASLPVSELTGLANGLWTAHVFAANDKVMRDAQTAFAVNLPVAGFTGRLEARLDKTGSPQVRIGINVAREGRFEVSGILFGHDANGKAEPFAVAQSAAWLPSGKQSLDLPIDAGLLASSGLKAPFEIRQVQLKDQSRLAPVQTVVEGITLSALPEQIRSADRGFARR